jgi:hypothetical protein
MASLRREVHIHAHVDTVWDALRDVGALHTRLAPGFVVDTRMEGNTRVVRFGNGMEAREDIVGIDDGERRVCWAIVGAQFHHYNGVAQVTPHPLGGSHFVWTADLLPDEFVPAVESMMDTGIAVIKETMEAARGVPMPPETRETLSARPQAPARHN